MSSAVQVIEISSPESVLVGKPDEAFPVDARRLHAWLGIDTQFINWIVRRVEEYGFAELSDYCTSFEVRQDGRGKQKKFSLSLNMAKELAMVERNEKGRQARKYFLACEASLKSLIVNKKQWHLARAEGKDARRVATDIIKAFIEYAKDQGSQSAEMYYVNFSKMVNAALLELDGKAPTGLRDMLNTVQLHSISVAESVIARILIECMTKKLPYKQIYQIAKENISSYAAVVGKTRPGISTRQYIGLIA